AELHGAIEKVRDRAVRLDLLELGGSLRDPGVNLGSGFHFRLGGIARTGHAIWFCLGCQLGTLLWPSLFLQDLLGERATINKGPADAHQAGSVVPRVRLHPRVKHLAQELEFLPALIQVLDKVLTSLTGADLDRLLDVWPGDLALPTLGILPVLPAVPFRSRGHHRYQPQAAGEPRATIHI